MHDTRDRQLNLAPGLRHPATGPKDIWYGLPIRARRRGSARAPFCAPLPGFGGHFRRV